MPRVTPHIVTNFEESKYEDLKVEKEKGQLDDGSFEKTKKSLRFSEISSDEDDDFKSKNDTLDVGLYDLKSRKKSYSTLDPTSVPKYLKRNASFSAVLLNKNERRVLVIYTGGTIGMIRSPNGGGYIPAPNMLEKTLRKFPHMHDDVYGEMRFGEFSGEIGETPLVLPEMHGEQFRIVYTIFEYDPLLDSSNLTMDDWIHIAYDLKENYEAFDGFVILHGTDTMAYSASALSFMLEHLGKSVVITGSQIPLFESRSDGRDNFLGALILAGSYVIPEVTVFFGHRLFRGNRITKVSSDSLNAFDSPNMSPLATMGINIQVDYGSIFRPRDISAFTLTPLLNRNVGLLRLFPSITPETVKVFFQPPTQGVVLQTYGAGNFPSNREDLLKVLEEASQRGILIVNCTQCGHGSVAAIYETGKMTQNAGVIPGWDMTPEAALTKLSYILARTDWNLEKKREMVQMNLRGELTKTQKPQNALSTIKRDLLNDYDTSTGGNLDLVQKIVKTVSQYLGYSGPEEMEEVRRIISPSMACALIVSSLENGPNTKNLELIFGNSEHEISNGDYSGRTPLHCAASLGNLEAIQFLLKKGASVHVRDKRGFSPLREAIEFDQHKVILLLKQCGAHLTLEPIALGAELCLAASKGDTARLESFYLAGASLDQKDPCGRTPLHAAVEAGHKNTVQWLISSGASTSIINGMGKTPIEIALSRKFNNLIDLFLPSGPKNRFYYSS